MPPGGHSHSSHHSSFSSHSTSHSSHSSSSHYSSYSSSTVKVGHVTKTRSVPRPLRRRTNQPQYYTNRMYPRTYRCKDHDYVYFKSDWTFSGEDYKRGYYTETGERFDNLILEQDGAFTSNFECVHCGTTSKEEWITGAIPHCPNCGANFLEMGSSITDVIDNETVTEKYQVPLFSFDPWSIFPVVVFGTVFAMFAAIFYFSIAKSREEQNKIDSNLILFGDSIYVESIDRTLPWNDEYDSYYDSVSDCYVWYNTDVEPAVWQYWYEDISSDYGDYGWMEYEIAEDQWYIEASNEHWITLPSKYDTSNLWYITGGLAGTSYSSDYNIEMLGDSITIDGGDTSYNWDYNMNSYFVSDHDCYVRGNFDVTPVTFHYWYEDISSAYESHGGGWMEYDNHGDNWFIEDSEGHWIEYTGDTSALWHVNSEITGVTGTVVEASN